MKLKKNKLFILFKSYLFLFFTILIIFYTLYKFYIFQTTTKFSLTQEKNQIETKKDIIQKDIQKIDIKTKYLKTKDGKERAEREVSLYKKKGEEVIRIIDF